MKVLPEISENECITPRNEAKFIRKPGVSITKGGSFRYLVEQRSSELQEYNLRSSVPGKKHMYDTDDTFMKYSHALRRLTLVFGSMLTDRLEFAMNAVKGSIEPTKTYRRLPESSAGSTSKIGSERTINSFSAHSPTFLRTSRFSDQR